MYDTCKMNEEELKMKKNLFITIGALILLIAFGLGIYQSNAAHANPKYSVDEIKEIVLTQYPGIITEVELEKVGTNSIYEVEMVYDDMKYEIKLNGNTSEIMHLKEKSIANEGSNVVQIESEENTPQNPDLNKGADKESNELENDVNITNKPKESREKGETVQNEKDSSEKSKINNKQTKETTIGIEKAIQIAKKAVPGTVIEAEIDKEDGRIMYEVEIINNSKKTEFDIDAYTGKIIDQKTKTTNKSISATKTVIDIEQAIAIALSEFPGTVIEVELDKENNYLVYEIEIKGDRKEADFDIDAYTGEIMSIEIEKK